MNATLTNEDSMGNGTSTLAPHDPAIEVSIIVPMLNEQDNVAELYAQVKKLMDGGAYRFEAIFIDDGSNDETVKRLKAAAAGDPRVTVVELTKRFGQTAGWAAGFARARGAVIVPIDADLQNDPMDIPTLVAKLDQPEPGTWDIVSGWRKNRKDKWMSRKLPSLIANRLVKRLTWTTEIHDFGCSMKAYRREVLEDVHLYGEMHRFLPAICKWRGARITEQVVNHRPRTAGESKYGLKRTAKVLLDLCTVKFMGDYLTKPIYFFGKLAMFWMAIAFAAVLVAILQKYNILTEDGVAVNLNNNVLVLFAMMTFLMSVMFVMIGVISELLVRIYHESQGRTPYKVRRITRMGEP
jgi:glycosyltransferase involved in cell wall biosynthesis